MFRIISILTIIVIFQTVGQKKEPTPFTVGLSFHYGFLWNHSLDRTNVKSAVLTEMQAVEASIQWHTLGKKDWHQFYKYPTWGMSLMLYNFPDRTFEYVQTNQGDGSIKNLENINVSWGQGVAWLIHKNIRLISTPFFQANIRLGTGIGTFTKPHHIETNPGNLWISSPVNTSMHLNLETKYQISEKYQAVLSGTFTHFSNGALSMPNLGINLPSVNIGIRYTPHPERIIYQKDSLFNPYKKNFLQISGSFGLRVLADYGVTHYPNMSFSIHYGRRIGKISKLFGGLDYFRDWGMLAEFKNTPNVDINRLGLYFGHEFMFGKAGLFIGMGRYLYSKAGWSDYYIKAGLRYHFLTSVYGAIILKTHWGQADTFEWTIGYTL